MKLFIGILFAATILGGFAGGEISGTSFSVLGMGDRGMRSNQSGGPGGHQMSDRSGPDGRSQGRGGPRDDRDRSNNAPGAPQGGGDFAGSIDTWNPNSSGSGGVGGAQVGGGGQPGDGSAPGQQGQPQQMMGEGGEIRRRGPRGSNKDAFDNAGKIKGLDRNL